MKYPHTSLVTLLIGAMTCAALPGASAQSDTRTNSPRTGTTVILPPPIPNGSNWSRAPFPARRHFDDVKGPDGQAVDNLPTVTPEPAPPPPRIAILQSRPAPSVTGDPGLMPTGRPAVALATSVDATTVAPTIRGATLASREQIIADVESRLVASETAMSSLRNTAAQMSADGRKQFNAASDDVRDKARALRQSIQKARGATNQDWENARAQLAADYEAYAAALNRVDMTVGTAR